MTNRLHLRDAARGPFRTRRELFIPTTYWNIIASSMLAGFVFNAILIAIYFAQMLPGAHADAVPLGLSMALTVISAAFLVVSTVWLRHSLAARPWRLLSLAFVGPAVGWTLLGIAVADWLLPAYAIYGLAAGAASSAIFALGLLQRRGTSRATTSIDSCDGSPDDKRERRAARRRKEST